MALPPEELHVLQQLLPALACHSQAVGCKDGHIVWPGGYMLNMVEIECRHEEVGVAGPRDEGDP